MVVDRFLFRRVFAHRRNWFVGLIFQERKKNNMISKRISHFEWQRYLYAFKTVLCSLGVSFTTIWVQSASEGERGDVICSFVCNHCRLAVLCLCVCESWCCSDKRLYFHFTVCHRCLSVVILIIRRCSLSPGGTERRHHKQDEHTTDTQRAK